MIKTGLKGFILNYSAFTKNLDISKIVIVIIYIENILFFRSDFIKINIAKSFLADQYKIKDLGSYK